MNLSKDKIELLQKNTDCVRNICILAHVDHGKTTLSDSLIASNGIISKKIAGKIRYLDSRPDEQLRGITMESSAISLFFKTINQQKQISEYLINLIDSPGHIDFSSEVSSVSRLCDGAIVLIDVVEGVCSQTITVLRQAWIDNLKPILVLNKIDRLILELQLTPDDAYNHLQRLVDQTNTIMASFYHGDVIGNHSNWNGDENTWIENSDEDIYFDPNLNNVIFTSAYDGWGFNLNQFSSILSKKTEIPKAEFDNKLWGNFTLDMKNKKLIEINKKSKAKPLFISFILDSIWKIYNSINDRDSDSILKITKSLNIKVLPKDLNSKDLKGLTQTIMSQFLPVSNSILSSIIDILPSPIIAQNLKIENLLKSIPNSDLIDKNLKQDLIECNQNGEACAYISKMLSIPESDLPENQPTVLSQDELYERGRIARLKAAKAAELASKTASKKKEDTIIKNVNENINNIEDQRESNDLDNFEFEFDDNFEYEEAEEDEDLDDDNTNTEVLVAFLRVYSGTIKLGDKVSILSPLFDVSKPYDEIENSKHHHEITIDKLYILMGRDLTPVKIAPAGTIVGLVSSSFKNIILKSGTLISTKIVQENKSINFAQSLAILDVPPIVSVTLEPTELKNMDKLLKGIKQLNLADPCVRGYMSEDGEVVLETAGELHLERCIRDLEERFAKVDITVGKPIVPFRETVIESKEVSFIIDNLDVTIYISPWENWNKDSKYKNLKGSILLESEKYHDILIKAENIEDTSLDGNFKSAFSLAIKEGPLLNEPLEGVLILIKSIKRIETEDKNDEEFDNNLSRIRDIIQSAVLESSPRIKLAMYVVDIQTSAELLGKVYTVIQKQRGQILTEEMKEGTPFFTVEAKLPVLTSFGFSEEIRKKTSGGAIPQLVFDGFDTIDEDPFWVPTTEEELEELGEKGDRENWIRSVMNEVRKSKGLFVDEKVVENAEKQRTLKKD
jgi:ribosome assembly protein 1